LSPTKVGTSLSVGGGARGEVGPAFKRPRFRGGSGRWGGKKKNSANPVVCLIRCGRIHSQTIKNKPVWLFCGRLLVAATFAWDVLGIGGEQVAC